MRTPRDPYTVLALESDATYEEAKAAYRRLAEIFHPDRFADARPDIQAEAERQMKDLNSAWRIVRARFGHGDETEGATVGRAGGSTRPPRARTWQAPDDDFSTRARQARTRERAQERRASGAGGRADEDRAPADAGRDEFVREARERLLREERAASGGGAAQPGE